MFPRNSWAWGTPAQRMLGGFPLRMLADSVLPYSAPPELDRPTWWVEGQLGQFEGYERNFAEGPEGAPNYPEERFLNAVLINMIGLKQSSTAPFRFALDESGAGLTKRAKDNFWPFGPDNFLEPDPPGTLTPVPALDVLRWYVENEKYKAAQTLLIVSIPERDFMNLVGLLTTESAALNWNTSPDPEIGEAAIIEYIEGVLKPVSVGGLGLSGVLVGWQLIDEPDLSNRRDWATPQALTILRNLIRRTELRVRREFEDGFAELPATDQILRLRPCLTTLSSDFIWNPDTLIKPADFTTQHILSEELGLEIGSADIFGFDWYPFRRTQADVNRDYPGGCTNPPPFASRETALIDPVRSLRGLRQLRLALNGGRIPGDPGYFPVFLWQQTDGWPFRNPSDAATASRSPAPMDNSDVVFCNNPASFRRQKLYPLLDRQQFYNWGGLLELSEGTVGFGQTNAPDERLKLEFAKVARETEFFAGLRHSSLDVSSEIVSKSILYGQELPKDGRDFMPLVVLYLDYLNQPVSPLGTANRWLIIVNRHFLSVRLGLTFKPYGPIGHFRLQRINFLASVGAPIILSPSTNRSTQGTIPPYSVRIFQARPG